MPNRAKPFWSLVNKDIDEDCWIWRGHVRRSTGYGEYCHESAHRIVYKKFLGIIPTGMHVHHLCNNKLCVNPEHLTLLTAKDHFAISPGGVCGNNKLKTHCKNGHELTGDNLYELPGGGRACKECRRQGVKFHRALKILNKI